MRPRRQMKTCFLLSMLLEGPRFAFLNTLIDPIEQVFPSGGFLIVSFP